MNAKASERGVALIIVLLMLMLTSTILAGFLVTTSTDTRLRSVDRARTRALYAAHGGLEKLTADLGDLFATDFAPNQADLLRLEGQPPAIEHMAFEASDGRGYRIEPANGFAPDGSPRAASGTVASGPFEGFVGLVTPYWLWVTAHAADGSEVRLHRRIQTVSIPVFQFGVFSESDLSFFAGPEFNFGGRVHTNGNLYLAADPGPLRLSDKVTAFGEVIRTNLANGLSTANDYTGQVLPVTAPAAFRPLARDEGSLEGTIGSALNEPKWTDRSIGTYHGYIRNGRTGAKNLQLPLVTAGGTPIELITRPRAGESALLTGQRLYSQANVRILLSNTAAAIAALPNSSSGVAPIRLDSLASLIAGNGNGAYGGGVQLAASSGVTAEGYRMGEGTPLIDGFLKVEYRNNDGDWVDVTAEILNLGFTRGNDGCAVGDAIIRVQRIKNVAGCAGAGATDYWPLTLYDTREGKPRDNEAAGSPNIFLSGVMHQVEFDVNNFRRWLANDIGASGANVSNEGGYTVYFSDRRTNINDAGIETGEFGWEDIVNPANANGAPNNALDAGEDLNSNNVLETYGQRPRFPAGMGALGVGPNLAANEVMAPLAAALPTTIVTAAVAQANRAVLFRRALKIVNAALGSLPADGLNITSENPVYVVGPFNATDLAFADPHAPAAIIADAVTLLSPAWSDRNSFDNPNNPGARVRTTTYYRFATIAGKNRGFQRDGTSCGGACPADYGTDAGTHNFLRLLESGGNPRQVNYRGSIASLYFSRQAVGVYKCCANVYGAPLRRYDFDLDFLSPSLLPPKTPMFRDVNTTGFMQVTRR